MHPALRTLSGFLLVLATTAWFTGRPSVRCSVRESSWVQVTATVRDANGRPRRRSLVLTAVLFIVAPGIWRTAGLGAVVVSQFVIVTSWTDAKFGTVANVLLLAGIVYAASARDCHADTIWRTHDEPSSLIRTGIPTGGRSLKFE